MMSDGRESVLEIFCIEKFLVGKFQADSETGRDGEKSLVRRQRETILGQSGEEDEQTNRTKQPSKGKTKAKGDMPQLLKAIS